jgi:hypothetical protein
MMPPLRIRSSIASSRSMPKQATNRREMIAALGGGADYAAAARADGVSCGANR